MDQMLVEMKLSGGITKDFTMVYLHLFFMMNPEIRTKTSLQMRAALDGNQTKLSKWDEDSWFTDEEMLGLNHGHKVENFHNTQSSSIHRVVYGFIRDNKELFY